MEDDRDLVPFTGEDGEDFYMEVLFYVMHEGDEYAVLIKADEDEAECDCGHDHEHGPDGECPEDCDCEGHEVDYYVMKVIPLEDEMEEFQSIEEELPDTLLEMIQARLLGEFDAIDEYDEDEDDEEDDDEDDDGEE